MIDAVFIDSEVRDALAGARPVVALETSVVAQGLPAPANLEAARACALAVRQSGAVPAFIAVVGGRLVVGASDDDLARLARPGARVAKAGVRDLAPCMQAGWDAATTVSATIAVAARTGIRVFATGGIGGVHRALASDGPLRDVSSDLSEMSRCPVCVVSAGPKVILDVAATAELLETLCVPVLGFGTSTLPAFYVGDGGVQLEHCVHDARSAAALLRCHWDVLGRREAVLLCVTPPSTIPAERIERALDAALARARTEGRGGKLLTPFLLAEIDRATGGAARTANVALLQRNAEVAGQVAAALAHAGDETSRR